MVDAKKAADMKWAVMDLVFMKWLVTNLVLMNRADMQVVGAKVLSMQGSINMKDRTPSN